MNFGETLFNPPQGSPPRKNASPSRLLLRLILDRWSMPETSQLHHFCKVLFTRAVLGTGRSPMFRVTGDSAGHFLAARPSPCGPDVSLFALPSPPFASLFCAPHLFPPQMPVETTVPFTLCARAWTPSSPQLLLQAWTPGGGAEGGQRAGPTFQTTRSHQLSQAGL